MYNICNKTNWRAYVAFDKREALGLNYYFYPHFEKTKIPLRDCYDYLFAAVPLIHGYTVDPFYCSRFALKKDMPPYPINGQEYRVKLFLTVQNINREFLEEFEGEFSPTVKPHYVFQCNKDDYNGGKEFSERCPTAIYIDHKNLCEGDRQAQLVWAHDGTLSPKISVPKLEHAITAAVKNSQDLFATSYVISHDNKEIYITSHCLLNQQSHDALFEILDSSDKGFTLENLTDMKSPIQKQLQDFRTGATVGPQEIESLVARPKVIQRQIATIIASYQSKTWYGIFLSFFGIKHMSKTMIALDNYVKQKESTEAITLEELQTAISLQNDDSRKMHRVRLFENPQEAPDNSGTDSVIENIKLLYS